jgi:hypothetical protein
LTTRARIVAYGSAVPLVIGGIVVLAAAGGTTAEVVSLVLIGLGFVALTGLVFLEVGLSEDRERERTGRRRERPTIRLKRPRPNLDRMRGERRRLK